MKKWEIFNCVIVALKICGIIRVLKKDKILN